MIALGLIGDADAIPAVTKSLHDPDRNIRLAAIRSLGQLAARESSPALRQGLASEDAWVRLYTAEALVAMGTSDEADIEAAAARERPRNFIRKRRWRQILDKAGQGGVALGADRAI